MNLRRNLLAGAMGAALLLGACSADDPSDPAAATTVAPTTADPGAATSGNTVSIAQSRFAPTELTVAAGTTVLFENTDPYAHTVTSNDASPIAFDSGDLGQDATFEQVFDEPGSYAYFCEIHPTMRATVVVQ